MKMKPQYCFLCGCGLGTEIVHEVAVTVAGKARGSRRVCFDCLHQVIGHKSIEHVEGRETFTARMLPTQAALFDDEKGGG